MRASIAIAVAAAGLASAAPHYGGYGEYEASSAPAGYPVPSSSAAGYPAPSSTPAGYPAPPKSTPAGYPVPSSPAGYPVPSSPAGYPVPSSSAKAYPTGPLVTKTVYQTSLYTVTSCKEYVTNCPAKSTIVQTTVIPAYTTVCPEDETPIYTPPAKPTKPVESVPAGHLSMPGETPCSTSTTVTVTIPHGSGAPGAPYPIPSGTGVAQYPPVVGTASGSGYVKPTSPAQFTGAASHAQVGGFVAGVGAFAALFL